MQLAPTLVSPPVSWKVALLRFVCSGALMRPDRNPSDELLPFPFFECVSVFGVKSVRCGRTEAVGYFPFF